VNNMILHGIYRLGLCSSGAFPSLCPSERFGVR
jgi:hypothetical protein